MPDTTQQHDTYEAALAHANDVGAANAPDPGAMALFCDTVLQQLVGAAAPNLVWEGAQAKGMTALQLNSLCLDDPAAVHDLMW